MMPILADVADPMVSGNWIIAVIGAIAAGIALVVGKKQGRNEAENSRDILIKKPVPTIQTREEPHWATKPDLDDFIERADKQFCDIWAAIQYERGIARDALGRIHQRLDLQSGATATLQGTVNEVNKTVGKLLDLAINHKSPGQ